jgi:hypothetical protein
LISKRTGSLKKFRPFKKASFPAADVVMKHGKKQKSFIPRKSAGSQWLQEMKADGPV